MIKIPFQTTTWDDKPVTTHHGESGIATWRTLQYDQVRIRVVEYSPGYKASHWCSKGHLVYCLEGEFTSHLKDGSRYHIVKGMSYQATDDEANPHLSTTDSGCTLWIIDGDFLKDNR